LSWKIKAVIKNALATLQNFGKVVEAIHSMHVDQSPSILEVELMPVMRLRLRQGKKKAPG
jgi:hypothetical protein